MGDTPPLSRSHDTGNHTSNLLCAPLSSSSSKSVTARAPSSSKSVTAHCSCVCKGRCVTKKCLCKNGDIPCGIYCHPGRCCVNVQLTEAVTNAATVDLTKEQDRNPHPLQEENWITTGVTRLTLQDERDLGSRSHEWLNDRHVTAAQHLLKQHHPDVSGLQPTILQLTRMFNVHHNREFVQCLNLSSNHWITVSTVGCPPGVINVYDSMHLGVPTSVKKVIADMMLSDKKFLSIRQVHIQQQMGGSDCGYCKCSSCVQWEGPRHSCVQSEADERAPKKMLGWRDAYGVPMQRGSEKGAANRSH